jgi:aldehyde oxidoreductase
VIKGDAAAALAGSAHVVEGAMTTAFVEHAYIEPEAGFGLDGGRHAGHPRLYAGPRDGPRGHRRDPGLPLDRVRIIPSATGGASGRSSTSRCNP